MSQLTQGNPGEQFINYGTFMVLFMVIGVGGKYCSGKNTLCSYLEKEGWSVIDADLIGHQVLKDKSQEVTACFGKEILDEKGSIDRKKLGQIVFSSKKELVALEAIVHPVMYNRISELCTKHPKSVINAALLEKMNVYTLCSRIIWVESPLCLRIKRALRRDKAGICSVFKRIFSQRKLKSKHLRKNVDIYTIRNGINSDLQTQALSFLNSMI